MMAQLRYYWKAGTSESQDAKCKVRNERSNLTELREIASGFRPSQWQDGVMIAFATCCNNFVALL